MARLLENRIWLEDDPLLPGSYSAWLEGGQYLRVSCWEVPRLSAWRWRGTAELVWDEGEDVRRAEVVAVGPDDLVLLVEGAIGPTTVRFSAVSTPPLC